MRALPAASFSLALILLASSIHAEKRTLLVSGIFADSSVVGPVARFITGDPASSEYTATLLGYTLEGEWVKHRSPRSAFVLAADITPINAHTSNRIYVDGDRAHELEYEAASYRVRTGLRLSPTARSNTDIQVVGLLEEIEDIEDASLRSFWDGPFIGLDLTHTYKTFSSENPLISSFEGIALSGRIEAFTGPESWSRVTVSERAGVQFGNVHLRQSILGITGKSLNIVNRAIIGGSWDVLGDTALYGFRYGEFRIARGILSNVGADYSLPNNWRIGVRGSYLRSDVADVYGAAVNASKVWKTFGFNLGIGFPRHESGASDAVFYLAVIAPLFASPR